MAHSEVRLTQLASAAGCAAKLGAGDLSKMILPLAGIFAPEDHPNILVGLQSPDDAAVMRLNDEQALIFTTDFFPPVVDDPYWYGAIAAANALSDVYAMGGRVLMALNIAAFPADLDPSILSAILRGGADKVKEAGGALVGGHTIIDQEPKYGLAVLGMVHPDKLFTKGGAQVGDHLILTKPLGVGIVNTAMKQGKAKAEDIQAAMQTMATLNKTAAQIAQNYPVHASSDITGFSLMGHAYEMASQSGHDFCINYADLHWVPGVDEYAALGIFPGGMGRNRAYYSQWAEVNPDLANDSSVLGRLYDPQTSGGLLLAVEPEASRALLSAFKLAGVDSRGIGSVEAGSGRVRVA